MTTKQRNYWVIAFAIFFFGLALTIFIFELIEGSYIWRNSGIIYDTSIAIFTGCLVYLLTISIPDYFSNKNLKEYLNAEVQSLEDYVNRRLKRIEIENAQTMNKELFKDKVYKFKYNDTIGNNKTVYDSLNEIQQRTDEFYQSLLPYVSQLQNLDLMDDVREIKRNEFFSRRRVFRTKALEEIGEDNVEIGGMIHDYLVKIQSLKNKI